MKWLVASIALPLIVFGLASIWTAGRKWLRARP